MNPPSSLGSSWPPSTSCRGHADDPEASDEWDMWCLSLSEHSILRAHPRRGTCQHTSWHVSAHAVARVSISFLRKTQQRGQGQCGPRPPVSPLPLLFCP